MTVLVPHGFLPTITVELFGGNFLGHRDSVASENGYSEIVKDLSISFLRFPGGSVTENYYSIDDPDRFEAINEATREPVKLTTFEELFDFASKQEVAVTVTLPTRQYLTPTSDKNGNRFAAIDEPVLRKFVNDSVLGNLGDVTIAAFEIGNEYWGSGRMSAIEYGRVSSKMAVIIGDTLDELSAQVAFDRPQIFVQMGTNFNYSSLDEVYAGTADEILAALSHDFGISFTEDVVRNSGAVDWTRVNNKLVLSEYDKVEEIGAIDGVILHLFSRDPALPGQRDFQLNVVEEMWVQSGLFDTLDIYVSEWNLSGSSAAFDRSTDYGLYQAQEMLNIIEAFSYWQVDRAAVWPLIQNTPNALVNGRRYEELTPAGEFFRIMSETLPGLSPVDFDPDDRIETELLTDDLSIHGFEGRERFELFVASRAQTSIQTNLDLSPLFRAVGLPSAVKLGVLPGESPGDNAAAAILTTIHRDDLFDDDLLVVSLSPGEILHVSFNGYIPSRELYEVAIEHKTGSGRPMIQGTAGEDRFELRESSRVDGGAGADTVILKGQPTAHTVSFVGDTIHIEGRGHGSESLHSLVNIERLTFSDHLSNFGSDDLVVGKFDGVTEVEAADVVSITELYIAYFNRAPDALGLHFWLNAYCDGQELDQIAMKFFDQQEHRDLYSEITDLSAYISAVYENVLGRPADAAGLDFWHGYLDQDPVRNVPLFVQAMLAGATSPTGDENDRAYLQNKTDIGVYFAAIKGLTDSSHATAAMELFDGSADSLDDALAAIEQLHSEALDPNDGEFLMPLVGIIDDPFAV